MIHHQVTLASVQAAADKYLPDFEDTNKTHTAVVCSPSQYQGVRDLFFYISCTPFKVVRLVTPPCLSQVRDLFTDKYGFQLKEIDDLEKSILAV